MAPPPQRTRNLIAMSTTGLFEIFGQPDGFGENIAEPERGSRTPPALDDLLSKVNVQRAWTRVQRNRGCPGVDGISITELEPVFTDEWQRVEQSLLRGDYSPKPLLRVRISKPSGGVRLLGIPSVMDRVVQQALAQAFSPCWETRFSSCSFAYRPGRGAKDALRAVESALNSGAIHVLHLDIEKFFDSVPHPVVLTGLCQELADERLANLLCRILSCGAYEDGIVRPTTIGIAQGSPLSPLLANIVLHRLDTALEAEGWTFVRYADDCVILLRDDKLDPVVHKVVVQLLGSLGLRLNDRKTSFSHFTAARFLGFSFQPDARGRVTRCVSPEALAEAGQSLLMVVRTVGADPEGVAQEVARMLASWMAYFYTPSAERPIRALVNSVVAAWRERFPGCASPECLQWEVLQRGRRGENVDYNGHFQGADFSPDSVDWIQSLHCLGLRLLRSRWWHLEYNPGFGQRPAGVCLCLGRHRIHFRL